MMNNNESIADLAYHLWNARGRPHGSAEEDWLEAERQLQRASPADGSGGASEDSVDASLEETFPASDPPASHRVDLPPANAGDKWSAAEKSPKQSASSSRLQKKPAALGRK